MIAVAIVVVLYFGLLLAEPLWPGFDERLEGAIAGAWIECGAAARILWARAYVMLGTMSALGQTMGGFLIGLFMLAALCALMGHVTAPETTPRKVPGPSSGDIIDSWPGWPVWGEEAYALGLRTREPVCSGRPIGGGVFIANDGHPYVCGSSCQEWPIATYDERGKPANLWLRSCSVGGGGGGGGR